MTKRWLFLFVVVISVMLFASATGEMDEFEFFDMELTSFDTNESWNWGSEHSDILYAWSYMGVDEDIAQKIQNNHKQWRKILFRVEFTMNSQAPDDYYDTIRVTDFRINNCHDIQIYPRYSSLSLFGYDMIDINAELMKEQPCYIYLEAIAQYQKEDKEDLASRIQKADLECNVEFQPESNYRYKRTLSIKTNKAIQDKRYIDGGIKAYVKEINRIDKSEIDVNDWIDDDSQPLDMENKSAYKLRIGFEKQMPFDVYCVKIRTDSQWIQILPADEIMNVNRYDTHQNGREEEIEAIIIYQDNVLSEQLPDSLISCLFLEFSTEYFGENELNGTPANGVPGIRFQEPLKYN